MCIARFAQVGGRVWGRDFGEGFFEAVEDGVGASGDEDAFGLAGGGGQSAGG